MKSRTEKEAATELKKKLDEARAKGQLESLGPMEAAFNRAKAKKIKSAARPLPPVKVHQSTMDQYLILKELEKQNEIQRQQELAKQTEIEKKKLDSSLSKGIGTQMEEAVWKLKNKDVLF